MKISLNEIKKLVPVEVETDELIRLIGSRLVEVEGSEDWGKKFENIYIVKVLSAEPIPDTHLHLCQIDAGKDPIQVVCGAPNVRAGMFAVWIAPGAIVPATYGTDDEFKIDSRKLRGYESHGMLAGLDELALGDDHSGIVEIDPTNAKPGTTFAEAFDLNDIILDIENKSLTHRPDCFGLIGFAREVAGILGVKFNEPSMSSLDLNDKNLEIQIEDEKLCQRYSCAVMQFSDAPHSKYLTSDDVFLAKADMRGISPIVDITNILMLKTGQPLHAFDYDKFVKVGGTNQPKIIIRAAKNGENLELLDSKTIECDENDILITSNDVPVALAGAMGGKNTEIDENTKHIILESATFSLYHLRKTQMKHGIFSEAITRFTKGQPASQTMPVLATAVKMLGGNALEVADCFPARPEQPKISLSLEDINSLLGTSYDSELVTKTLENVGFLVEGEFTIKAPLWRTDIHIKEDIIEEVGRLLGYDNIPLDFAKRPFIGAHIDELLALKNRLRGVLSDRLSAHEVLTYSFVNQKLQETVGEDPNDSYEIVNSISPDLQRFRQTLAPSLLEKTAMNLKAGYRDFSIYEINQITKKSYGLNSENVPEMHTYLAFVTTGDFYQAKAYLVAMLNDLGLNDIDFSEFKASKDFPYLEPRHSAELNDICALGEVKARVLKALKIDQTISLFELNLEKLLEILPKTNQKDLKFSRFPSVSRDITLKVELKTKFEDLKKNIENALSEKCVIYSVEPVSIYQAEAEVKNLSFKLTFSSLDHTLNAEEISDIMKKVESSVTKNYQAEIV